MHPVACVLDAVEVVDRHLRVTILESLEMPLVEIAGLFAINVLHWLLPLFLVVLQQVVTADVVVSLKGQQLQVDQPREAAVALDDAHLEQRSDVLAEGVLVDFCVDRALPLLEIDAV